MYCGVPATTPDLRQAGVVGGAGQAEVGDLDALDAVLQQDVGRLDVAMDQPLRVGGRQALRRSACRCAGSPSAAAARRLSSLSCSDWPAMYSITRYGAGPSSSTAWMVTTWSWLTAAAARGPRG